MAAASFSLSNPAADQRRDLLLDKGGPLRILRRHPFAHLFAHEHRVGADVNDAVLLVQALDQGFDLRINQRFAAADRDHRRVAFLRRGQAILQRQDVFQRSGIFTNPTATGARKITGMQRLELQHGGKFLRPTKLVADDIGGDLARKRERKSHKCPDTNKRFLTVNGASRRRANPVAAGSIAESIPGWP